MTALQEMEQKMSELWDRVDSMNRVMDHMIADERVGVENFRRMFSKYKALRVWAEGSVKLMRGELLTCENNDCRCREGYGLCNQCKEAVIRHVKAFDEIDHGVVETPDT